MNQKEEMPELFQDFWYGSNTGVPTKKINSLDINENVSKEWRQFLLALQEAANRNWK